MEFLFSWIEKYIVIFLLFAVMSYLIPQETYRKYIKFFMQLVFVLLLAAPIFSLCLMEKRGWGEILLVFCGGEERREKEAEELSFLDESYIDYVIMRLREEEM